MTRIAYEQFPYQESTHQEIGRSKAIFVDQAGLPGLEVLGVESTWQALLGASVEDAVGAAFFLFVGAAQNLGRYEATWLDQSNFTAVLENHPRAAIESVAGMLTATPSQMRDDFRSAPPVGEGLDRYAYNPLAKTPFVQLDEQVIAPQPRFILRAVSPDGLFYRGIAAFGPAFSRDLGRLVEHYVGRQLKLTEHPVLSEIEYGQRRGERKKSIDWFLILPDLVVLFEVKSSRMTLSARAGDQGLVPYLERTLGHAIEQIDVTEAALVASVPEFSDVPTDRPRVGVVVTAEPHYIANSQWADRIVGRSSVPTFTCSLLELERLVTLSPDVLTEAFRRITEIRDFGGVVSKIQDLGLADNPIVDEAWNSFSWVRGLGLAENESGSTLSQSR